MTVARKETSDENGQQIGPDDSTPLQPKDAKSVMLARAPVSQLAASVTGPLGRGTSALLMAVKCGFATIAKESLTNEPSSG